MMSKLEYTTGDINSTDRGSGARASGGKVSLSLIPLHLLAGVARVFMGGKLKYAEWNWAKGMPWHEPMDCLLRHLFKWWFLGEELDAETGEHHLDHAMCNLFMLQHYVKTFKEGDDRPPANLTAFNEELDEFNTPFDEDAFYKRNPHLRKNDNE